MLRKEGKKEPLNFIMHLEETFTDNESINSCLDKIYSGLFKMNLISF
jgi:hypothetical protein